MFAIEVSHGRYEAETEKEARKLFRKGEKVQRQKEKEQAAESKLAYDRAKSVGYDILTRIIEAKSEGDGKPFPRGWRVKKPGDQFFRVNRGHSSAAWHDTATYETEAGTASFEHWGYRVLGILWNGSGFDTVTFLQDTEHGNGVGPVHAYAVGVAGNQVRLADLPGVTLEMFQPEEQAAA